MKLKNFEEAVQFLYAHIPPSNQKLYPGPIGVERTKYVLKLVGSPQEKLKVIHIAGTSGKGSTSYLTSILLNSHGFKVGLHVSPHILDIRERIQIDNRNISKEKFVEYLNDLVPIIEQTDQSKLGRLTYAELLVILAFYSFFKESVDFTVIETNLGGLFDTTNSVDNPQKIAIITQLGLDHTKILGRTIREIAIQKAGIIQNRNRVVTLWQAPLANLEIEKRCKLTKSQLTWVKPETTYSKVKVSADKTLFYYEFGNYGLEIELKLIGKHQAQNCSLALTAFIQASEQYGFQIKINKILNILKTATWPGRFEQFKIGKSKIIIDGAHNSQKMASLLQTLKQIYPDRKFNFLLSFKQDKNVRAMLKTISKRAFKIYLSNFFTNKYDWHHVSKDLKFMEDILRQMDFKNFESSSNHQKILKKAIEESEILVITGSIYFISELYPLIKNRA